MPLPSSAKAQVNFDLTLVGTKESFLAFLSELVQQDLPPAENALSFFQWKEEEEREHMGDDDNVANTHCCVATAERDESAKKEPHRDGQILLYSGPSFLGRFVERSDLESQILNVWNILTSHFLVELKTFCINLKNKPCLGQFTNGILVFLWPICI